MTMMNQKSIAPVQNLSVTAFKVPTEQPESDGTYAWDATTMVVVEVHAANKHGLGWTYADTGTARLVMDHLASAVTGQDGFAVTARWQDMVHAVRNLGQSGVASMAISAVDTALWDLKARIMELPLTTLWGQVRPGAVVYGSGGFSSYSVEKLQEQLGGWAHEGLRMVKMKVGRNPSQDEQRVQAARSAIDKARGNRPVALFVDANGAYSRKQALDLAQRFAEQGVGWFEEPVSSDDLDGLRLMRDRAPSVMDIAAGEYGYDPFYFRRMLQAGAVDVLQADVTRCGGFTGLMQVAALCQAFSIPLSLHCAPSLHLAAACSLLPVVHLEYFHDHARLEPMLLDGCVEPRDGVLYPDLSRPGLGLALKRSDAERWKVAL